MTERVPMQKCPCGCGEYPAAGRKYVDYERCRQRLYRRRVREAAQAAGVPAVASFKGLEGLRPTWGRSGYGESAGKPPQRRRRAGVSVYFPTVEDAEHAALACAGIEVADEAFGRAIERRKAKA